MKKLLTALLDIVFPPQDSHVLVAKQAGRAKSLYQPGRFTEVLFLSRYTDPVMMAAVREHKFYANPAAAKLLANLLRHWHQSQPADTLYVPIPLSRKRQRERGFNQVTRILEQCAPEISFTTTLIQKNRDTTPQSHLKKTSRAENVRGVFVCDHRQATALAAQHIVLIDDVVTTGATMLEARATLAPHLPPHTTLTCLAIAH